MHQIDCAYSLVEYRRRVYQQQVGVEATLEAGMEQTATFVEVD